MGSCLSKKQSGLPSPRHSQLELATYETTEQPDYRFTKAKVIKVYDGDTFWIAAWYNNEITRFCVRLYGIDCPEIRGGTEETKRAAQESKQFIIDHLYGRTVDIEVLNNRKVGGKKITEKYGRLLAKIRYDGKDLAEEMIRLSLGKPYFGGHKD